MAKLEKRNGHRAADQQADEDVGQVHLDVLHQDALGVLARADGVEEGAVERHGGDDGGGDGEALGRAPWWCCPPCRGATTMLCAALFSLPSSFFSAPDISKMPLALSEIGP